MTHVLLIDPLEKLVIKKDSSLMLADSLARCFPTYVMFRSDLIYTNGEKPVLQVYSFESDVSELEVKKFELHEKKELALSSDVTLHMRLDPPVDSAYIRTLWLLKAWEDQGVNVVNSARGILIHNEKLAAYTRPGALPTYVGENPGSFMEFVDQLEEGCEKLVFKPLDLYQGIGVQSLSRHDEELPEKFEKAVVEYNGPVVAQPFWEKISEGEIRSIWVNGEQIGSINKVPQSGSFMANIAQGASFERVELSDSIDRVCRQTCHDLMKDGVSWLAFDILGDSLSEVNLTCPGLLVEVSKAMGENLADRIVKQGFAKR